MKPVVIYAAPNFTENAVRFIQAFVEIPDITFGLITQEPLEWLRPDVRSDIAAHRRVEDVFSPDQLTTAAGSLAQELGPIHRILGAVEQLQAAIAVVRERMGIAGMNVETILNFRDKGRMKNLLRTAGIPCARHRTVASAAEARAFVSETGFPLVVKPPAGAGSQSTFKVNDAAQLEEAMQMLTPAPGHEVLLEEFMTGTEHSFDTFSLNGTPVFYTITHYFPNPLEVMREPWIQWQVLLPREADSPEYEDIRRLAFRTLEALGMQTGMTHLEWFRRPDGSIAISEVAARPPGAQFPTLISRACDFDAIAAWARLMIFDTFPTLERRYASGAAYLRGQGQGRVAAVHGLDQVEREVGHLITDTKIPQPGQEKSTSYEGEGYIIVRHPETAVVKRALDLIVSTVRVELRV